MEQKCLKTTVCLNNTIFHDSLEQPIDIDFTLPDFCPDISKIFKCRAMPRITSKELSGKSIVIEGQVDLTLLYSDRENRLCSYEYQYPFSKTIDTPCDTSEASISCKAKTEYINCRAITGRKVDIHGAVRIHIKLFKRCDTEIVSDFDDENIELKRLIMPATLPMGYAEKYLTVEEEIHIGQGQPNIEKIIRYDANSYVKETKLITDKAVVKGELCVNILYCPENSCKPQIVKTILPFSQIIDIKGVTEDCRAETLSKLSFLEVKPRLSVSGENKCFSLTAKILLTVDAYCSNEIAVILDAFSRKFESDISQNKIPIEKITHDINETYHCKKTVETEESIAEIIDMWCDVQSFVTKFENCEMLICGTIIAGMVLCDENEAVIYTEKPIDFEYRYPVSCSLGTPHCSPQIEIISKGFTLTSANRIELSIELKINASVYEKKELSLISDISLNETRPIENKNEFAMTIYFADDNEAVWDIARKYNASVDEIMNINSLENEILPQGKMILIPVL